MTPVVDKQIEGWEDDGGAAACPDRVETSLRGTENQVEWAIRIRRQVNQEFDRVAAAFRVVARGQESNRRADTETIIAILEDKRAQVMSNEDAGYFIRGWQETGEQVRQLIFQDARYQAIKTHWRRQDDTLPSETNRR